MFELNGYQLPDFPASGYPYAMISFDSSGGCAYLTFVDKVGYIKKNIIDNVWYGNIYTLGLTADMAHDESKVIYEESYVVMLDEAYKDALELLYPGINKTSWLRYTPSSKQTPSGGYYALAMNYGPQWANFTLYDEDGNLFLSAGKKFKLRGWLGWLLAGLCSRAVPVVETRAPVAYLYNGVRLPPIPSHGGMSYELISKDGYAVGGGTAYYAWVTTDPWKKIFYGCSIQSGSSGYCYIYSEDTGNWERVHNWENKTPFDIPKTPTWANHNVLNSDGSLYLAASDPIPVYE